MAVEEPHRDAPERDAGLAVDDPEKYSQQRRLRTIHDWRDEVLNRRDSVFDAIEKGQISKSKGLRYYRRAIENYILEIEPLLLDEDLEDVAMEFLNEEKIGSMTIFPPRELYEVANDEESVIPGEASIPTEQTRHFRGLRSIRDAEEPIQETFSLPVKRRHEPIQKRTWTATAEIPTEILDNAFQATNRFLRTVDVDTSLRNDDREASFDYSDLLPRGERAEDGDADADSDGDSDGDDDE